MSLKAIAKSSTDFKVLEQGTHLAICNAVIGVGLQDTPWGAKEKVYIRWEVPSERVEFEKDGQEFDAPLTIWANYTNSLSNKANLRHVLEGWLGRTFTREEVLSGFELFNLVGMPCLLTVVHNESGERTYANVLSISMVMKGQVVPPQELDPITYSPNAIAQWNDLPDWLKEKVRNQVKNEPEGEERQAEFKDDIPFGEEAA